MKGFVAAWLVLGLFSLAWAQLDPKAAPFLTSLDYSNTFQGASKPKTLSFTLCVATYQSGKAEPEICTSSAVDYVKRRIAVHTTSREEPLYDVNVVYQGGRVYATDFPSGKLVPMPAAQAKPLEKMLEKSFDTVVQGNFTPDQFERTYYDGPVSYGKIIRGEQVSATVKLPFTDLESSDPKPTTVRLVFGKNKELLGTIAPTPEGELLSVISNPRAKPTLAQFLGTTNYLLKGKKPVLTSKNRLVRFQFNKPLDENLFAVPKN